MGYLSASRRALDWIRGLVSRRPDRQNNAPPARMIFDSVALDDPAAMGSRPFNAYVRGKLDSGLPQVLNLYDNETRIAWNIVSDGKTVALYGVAGVTKPEAFEIWAICGGIREWTRPAFVAAVYGIFRPGTVTESA